MTNAFLRDFSFQKVKSRAVGGILVRALPSALDERPFFVRDHSCHTEIPVKWPMCFLVSSFCSTKTNPKYCFTCMMLLLVLASLEMGRNKSI